MNLLDLQHVKNIYKARFCRKKQGLLLQDFNLLGSLTFMASEVERYV